MELSIVIPARHEEFLGETVDDIVKNRRAETEVIVGLDGEWPMKPIRQYPDVNYVYFPESIGQRAITNRCVDISKGKYIMKVDAHCAFDVGFDKKMIENFVDDSVMVPMMKNLHVYDWKCPKCGERVYQDKINICPKCSTEMVKKMLWRPRPGSSNWAYYFSPEPKFGYFGDLKKKTTEQVLVETMSIQGSCFMCSKENYLKLNLCDEELGSWGSQGIEVACKFWLSGRRVLSNKKTWYAHCFRTKAEFGFPYKQSGRQIHHAKKTVKELFFKSKWPQQTKPLSWLVKKFWPVPEWTDNDLKELENPLA